jgi:DNA-binding NtrC family response regulator
MGSPIAESGSGDFIQGIVGSSPAMRRLRHLLCRVAAADGPTLLCGETGSGKEAAGRAIHARSGRRDAPCVIHSFGNLPESLAESLLFGAEKGAHSEAKERTTGLFEQANGGVLILDELDKSSFGLQAKLLRALESGEIRRVGGKATVTLDVRVVGMMAQVPNATGRVEGLIPDLYYRLAGFVLTVPPLRERREDIPELCAALCDGLTRDAGRMVDLAPEVTAILQTLDWPWPGNVRELRQVLLQATLHTDGPLDGNSVRAALRERHVQPAACSPQDGRTADQTIDLAAVHGQLESGAALVDLAQALKIHRGTLSKKLSEWRSTQGLPPRRCGRPRRQ